MWKFNEISIYKSWHTNSKIREIHHRKKLFGKQYDKRLNGLWTFLLSISIEFNCLVNIFRVYVCVVVLLCFSIFITECFNQIIVWNTLGGHTKQLYFILDLKLIFRFPNEFFFSLVFYRFDFDIGTSIRLIGFKNIGNCFLKTANNYSN